MLIRVFKFSCIRLVHVHVHVCVAPDVQYVMYKYMWMCLHEYKKFLVGWFPRIRDGWGNVEDRPFELSCTCMYMYMHAVMKYTYTSAV